MNYPKSWNKPSLTPEQIREWKSWIHELRTTTKKQGRSQLSRNGRYCCLGIRCEQAVTAERVAKTTHAREVRYGGATLSLPFSELPVLGINDEGVLVPLGFYKKRLCGDATQLNDEAQLTFKQIADVLEWAYLDGPRPEFYKEEA